jgi:hypothetical protein
MKRKKINPLLGVISPTVISQGMTVTPINIGLNPVGLDIVKIGIPPNIQLSTVKPGGVIFNRPIDVVGIGKFSKASFLNPRDTGILKENLTCPIAKTGVISDEVLFELPQDASKQVYVPRYRIATQRVSGQLRFRIALEQDKEGVGGKLIVFLEKYPAPALERMIANAGEMRHELLVILNFRELSGITQSLPFQEIETEGAFLKATLKLTLLSELNQIYLAMTNETKAPTLLIQRKIDAAVPVFLPTDINALNPNNQLPLLVIKNKEQFTVSSAAYTRVWLSIQNKEMYPDALFAPAPDLPPCGLNKNASRTWINIIAKTPTGDRRIYGFCALGSNKDLQNLWFAFPNASVLDYTDVHVELEDRRTNFRYKSNAVNIQGKPVSDSPLYRLRTEQLKDIVEPFAFTASFAPYIYKGVFGSSGQGSEYIGHQVTYKGNEHFYLQDASNEKAFFFLPDEFRLTRRSDDVLFHKPHIIIAYNGNNLENLKPTMDYKLVGFVDEERKEKAQIELEQKLKLTNTNFKLLGLGTDNLTYKLNLPTGKSERSDATKGLGAIDDTLRFDKIDDFRNFYVKLKSTTDIEGITGTVDVKLQGFSIPNIPVKMRFNNMLGEVFRVEHIFDAAINGYHVTLTNIIESEVTFKNLIASVLIQGNKVPTPAEYKDLTLPTTVLPSQSLKFDIIPKAGTPNLQTATLLFQWDNMTVKLDEKAVYDSHFGILDSTSYKADIMVRFFVFPLDPNIDSIEVNFATNKDNTGSSIGTTTLSKGDVKSEEISKPVALKPPIRDYILSGNTSVTRYWYQLQVLTNQGKRLSEWTEDSDDLNINTALLPKN